MSHNFYDVNAFEKDELKTISKLFFCLTLSLAIPYLFLTLLGMGLSFLPGISPSVMLIINDSYTAFVILLFVLFTRRFTSRRPLALSEMTAGKFFLFACASVPLMLFGALIGNAFSTAFGNMLGRDVANALDSLTEEYPFGLVFVSVIIVAPVFEELMFRKILIDKLSRFGFSFSVLISGLVFGTFHGNFYQLFYGCFLGFLLASVYCIYARLRYCIALHSLLNFIGFVCPIYLEKFLSSESLILNFLAVCYSLVYYACIPFGIIVIAFGIKSSFGKFPYLLNLSGIKLVFRNYGFLCYIIFIAILIALSIFM